jgi:membrane peptidoglycan carboxypeptidase
VERIVGADGKAIALPERQCTQQIDAGIAHTISQVLVKDTKPGFAGTANRRFTNYYAAGGSDIAGKTGTASTGGSGKNSSAWFIGYTPDVTASVATFNPDAPSSPLTDVPGYPPDGTEVFGSFSSTIWRDALSDWLLARPRWQFPPEDPGVVNGNSVPVPSVVGQDINTAAQILASYGFGIEVSTQRKDSPLPPDRIAEQSPSGRGVPGQKITVYLSSGKGAQPGPVNRTPGPPRRRR